jgi:hypothetical protein
MDLHNFCLILSLLNDKENVEMKKYNINLKISILFHKTTNFKLTYQQHKQCISQIYNFINYIA